MGKYWRFLIRSLIGLVLLGLPASVLGAEVTAVCRTKLTN